jgi:hypothetical protein
MNYVELKENIARICENEFTEPEYALFAEQAEQRIYSTVQLANLRKSFTGALAAANQYLQAPTDFLSVYSIAIYPAAGGAYEFLLNKDVNFIRQAYPNPATTGKPKHYAIFGPSVGDDTELRFIVGPTPNAAYNVELNYFYYPESIVTAGNTWLGDNFDSALMNGALVEAIRYMKGEPDMVKFYQEMYLQSIALLKNLGDGKQRGDSYRDGQVRIQVN